MGKHVFDNVLSKTFTVEDTDAQSMVGRFPSRYSVTHDPVITDPFTVTPTASPFTYVNTYGARVQVFVSGGTVSAIQLGRIGTNYATGITAGTVILDKGDSLTITYTVAPTVNAIPLP